MGRVALVRHGQTEFNKGGESAERLRGWIDLPLDKEGQAEAHALAKEFRNYDVESLYSSPLARARFTADAIAKACKVNVHVMASLLPWNLGELQGHKVVDVKRAMAQYIEQDDVGPKGGETFKAYRLRFLPFLASKIQLAQSLPKDDLIILVTHSRGLQTCKAWQAAGCPDDFTISVPDMNDYTKEIGTGGVLLVSAPKEAA